MFLHGVEMRGLQNAGAVVEPKTSCSSTPPAATGGNIMECVEFAGVRWRQRCRVDQTGDERPSDAWKGSQDDRVRSPLTWSLFPTGILGSWRALQFGGSVYRDHIGFD
jgi:hypothetical protein